MIKTPKNEENYKIYQLVNTNILMSIIQWNYVPNLKWFWLELDSKHDLIRNINIFPRQQFLSKISDKTHTKNQLVYTHILMGIMQWIHVANLKWFWWELHKKLDLIRNLNIFSQDTFFYIKTLKKHPKIQKIIKYIKWKSCTYW